MCNIRVSLKVRTLPTELCPKLWTLKIWPRHVHRRRMRQTSDGRRSFIWRRAINSRSSVDRWPSPVDHTQCPAALCTGRWSIRRGASRRAVPSASVSWYLFFFIVFFRSFTVALLMVAGHPLTSYHCCAVSSPTCTLSGAAKNTPYKNLIIFRTI